MRRSDNLDGQDGEMLFSYSTLTYNNSYYVIPTCFHEAMFWLTVYNDNFIPPMLVLRETGGSKKRSTSMGDQSLAITGLSPDTAIHVEKSIV